MSSRNGHSKNGSDSGARHEDRTFADLIQEQPVACLALAAAAGFVLGGGMRRSNGLALLALMGQIAVRDALANFVDEALNSHAG